MEIMIRNAVISDYESLCEVYVEFDEQHRMNHPELFIKPEDYARAKDYILESINDSNKALFVGSGSNFLIEYIFVLVGLTRYEHIIPFNIGVLPIWTVLSWAPAIMLFLYFLPQSKETYIRWMYILMWSTFTWGVAVIFRNLGILVFIKGGPWIWFITGLVSYHLLIKYYRFLETRSKDY